MEMLRALLVFALVLEASGIAISILLLFDSKRDLEAIQTNGVANGRRMVARSAIITEWFRLTSLLLLTGSSAASIVVLWDLPHERLTSTLLFAMWAFEAAALMIVAQSVTVFLTRRRLFDGYRRIMEDSA